MYRYHKKIGQKGYLKNRRMSDLASSEKALLKNRRMSDLVPSKKALFKASEATTQKRLGVRSPYLGTFLFRNGFIGISIFSVRNCQEHILFTSGRRLIWEIEILGKSRFWWYHCCCCTFYDNTFWYHILSSRYPSSHIVRQFQKLT